MHDVLVVGGGIAGLRAAIAAKSQGGSVAVVSKSHPTRSHSVTVQDGINASLQPGDGWESHAADTLAAGNGLGNPDAVNAMCREAPELVHELDRMGVPFNRQGTALECLQLPGSSQPRTAFVDDMSGLVINQTLYEQALRSQVEFYDEWTVTALVVQDGACRGVVALELATGNLELLSGRAVVLATGGPRRLYEPSTGSLLCTGDGLAMAYRAGVPLVDMEFVQYHPAVLSGSRMAITALAWAYGATIQASGKVISADGAGTAAFVRAVQKAAELNGGTVELRIERAAGQEQDRLFNTWHRVKQLAGVDITQEPVPVRPAMHRLLGGIAVDAQGATEMPGLYAAGETVGSGVHGAAGQDGNYLLAAVATGRAAGLAAAEHARGAPSSEPSKEALKKEQEAVAAALERKSNGSTAALRRELASLMHSNVGMVRAAKGLKQAIGRIQEMKQEYGSLGVANQGRDYNYGLVQHLELGSLLDVAEVIAASALERTESRGVHYRSDHVKQDDGGWLKHLTTTAGDSGPQLKEHAPVSA